MPLPTDPRRDVSVAHVITGLQVGGAEGFLARLLPRLEGSGVRSSVYSLTDDGPNGALLGSAGIPVTALGFGPTPSGLMALPRLRRALRADQPDVVMTWLPDSDLLGGAVARSCGIPVVWNVRQSAGSDAAPLRHRLVERLNAKLSHRVPTRIVAVSPAARSSHVAIGYPASRLSLLPNGFDTDHFAPNDADRTRVRDELGVTQDQMVIGHVARLDPVKDHPTLLRAFVEVLKERPTAVLVMAGDGTDSAEMAEMVSSFGVAASVRRLGRRTDVAALNNAFDVAVSSSLDEGMSNVLGEAMACGVPCVATDVGNAAEMIGDTGMVVAIRDAKGLAGGILRSLALRVLPPADTRQRISSCYSLDVSVREYAVILNSVAHSGVAS